MHSKLRTVTKKMVKKYVTCSLYKFVTLDNCEMLRESILNEMKLNDLLGTILLAEEGINGTISGAGSSVDGFVEFLSLLIGSDDIDTKRSTHDEVPFYRAKVKLKREIVSMGVEHIDPKETTGIRVDPVHWNNLINDPEVLVIDTRNSYEVGIGTFKDAVNPNTKSFRDFPEWAHNNINPQKHSKVAMFCTGGIRCEKATAYAKSIGVKEVYQLEGGILNYLRTVPEDESLWSGECLYLIIAWRSIMILKKALMINVTHVECQSRQRIKCCHLTLKDNHASTVTGPIMSRNSNDSPNDKGK